MKLHSILLVKNEADVIGQTLPAAAEWCDHIYVLDNGSTDGTWEQVQALAERLPQVVPWKRDERRFGWTLRGEVFNQFRSRSARGDWWCRLDADEVYIDDPRQFLARVPWWYRSVWSASFQFYFTDRDLELYEEDPSRYGDDVPVAEKCRWYINNWSEMRFFRYSPGLRWTEGRWPLTIYDAVYPRRIRLKHYQYRSPEQIQRRLDARRNAPSTNFTHERAADWEAAIIKRAGPRRGREDGGTMPESWRERVVRASNLLYDDHDGRYEVNEAALSPIPSLPMAALGSGKRLALAAVGALRDRRPHRAHPAR
jgi:glycosyltransferase involved in cell wall biosynthesis